MTYNPKYVNDCLTIMRVALGRRNANDPDSSSTTFLGYLNDFLNLMMPNDVKLFENFGTLVFTIDENGQNGVNDGVYSLIGDNRIPNAEFFANYSLEAFISLLDPINESISWNVLNIYQDPGQFYSIWGVNNYGILIEGYPTNMLYYGTDFVFRTIPNKEYQVQIYGYKINPVLKNDQEIPFNFWVRYLAYGAACNYARDYRYESSAIAQLEKHFSRERKLLLTKTHNQVKLSRAFPRF